MAGVWQQCLALDARYNAHRVPNNPQFRTQYIRRRSQLLRENAKKDNLDPAIRKHYLKIRNVLLADRYGVIPDQGSIRSRSLSTYSRGTLTTSDSPEANFRFPSRLNPKSEGVVPTSAAAASKAIVGDTTIAENYAFAGVHHIFDIHKEAVPVVKFANNDKSKLAFCSLDGTLSICQLIPAPPSVLFNLQGHRKGVKDFEWSTSNDVIVSCSLDGTVRLWNTSNGKCLRVLQDCFQAEVLSCVFHPLNNNMIVTGNSKSLVQVLNISTGIYPKGGGSKTTGQVLSLAFDSVGSILWAGDDRGSIVSYLYDLPSGRLTKYRRIVVHEDSPITCLSSRNWASREARNPSLLVSCGNNALYLFSVTGTDGSLQIKKQFTVAHKRSNKMIHSSFCPIMSFRQGACVISGSEDMNLYFFDVEREYKPCVNKLQGHSGAVLDVCFNYDESLLSSSDDCGMVIIWKREQKK
ncbi:WD repeat-containing protein 13 [Nymphon striatum]|nr:WD repeat-containing protein 13 [Nymphon striatum]